MDYVVSSVLTGAGATALIDMWAAARRRLLGIPALDYGLVGRWLVHLARGRFSHDHIAATPPVHGERPIGWAAHYLIGVAFAAALLAIWGLDWIRQPTLAPALMVGLASAAAPFFIMQPGMGAGIAASHTPRPNAARAQTLITHAIFGLGLYVSARATNLLAGG
jgi:hypothetical protein